MTNEEIFRSYWKSYREEILNSAIRQQSTLGAVRHDELNERYRNGMNRFSSRMTSEGAWMNSIENEPLRREVLAAMGKLSLKAPEVNSVNQSRITLMAAAGGAVVGLVVGIAGSFSKLLCAGCLALGAVAGGALFRIPAKNKGNEANNAIIADYRRQMMQAEEEIAAIWRKNDG